ncbi:hypothetical protein AB0I49_06040 [Streptomyces sp. NPDC050617]|uniref:hypothetical protein n=1 Tax=Streptomyces sp. NPDC050617 TaxID=3154628 RepID=UPI003446C3AA
MWGRRGNAEARLLMEAWDTLAYVMKAAEEAHGALQDARARFEEALDQISATFGFGDGVPVDSIRGQLAQSQDTLESVSSMMSTFEEMHATWDDSDMLVDSEFEEIKSAAEFFTEYGQYCASMLPTLEGVTESLARLRDKLLGLPAKIAPVRERAYAAMAAATGELTSAGPSVPGRFALEARLNAAGDRLRALDAGHVEIDPDRKISDLYRDVETEIAEIRDAVPRPAY